MKFFFSLVLIYCSFTFPVIAQRSVTINYPENRQVIRGFGASDAWSNSLIGLMNDQDRRQVAEWLFSSEAASDSNSFRGIGLSVWRYNLGAGSTEQGDSSGIYDPFRRTELIIQPGMESDSTKQKWTRWMVKEAVERGVETLVMFCNSPPVFLTNNAKAFSGICGESNLPSVNNDDFAGHLVNSLDFFRKEGIHFDYISPVNEPEWDWCQVDGQEGNPYKNSQIADITRSLSRKLIDEGSGTTIQIPESGLLLFANPGYRFKPGRQDQIKHFFSPGGKNYVGDEQMVATQICSHSYFTEWPLWIAERIRKKMARVCNRYDIEYWMTEYCILKTTPEIAGRGRDLGINTALYVSRVMHYDLVYGNASAWCWWLGLSSADYKDGLVYVNRDGTGLSSSKTMWAMGNFSQFIRPGATRLDVKYDSDNEFLVSAYRNAGSDEIVLIIINMTKEDQVVEIENHEGSFTSWETSDSNNLQKKGIFLNGDPIILSARSITTLISNNP